MTKKRRTKKEKISAQSKNNNFDFVFNSKIEENPEKKITTSKQSNYSYILAESKNTLLITAIITIVNVLIFIALKQNYINLFGLDF